MKLRRINFRHAGSFLVLLMLGVACAGNRGPESNQRAVLPAIFSSEAGDTIEIYPDRLVIGGKRYAGVDCSVAEYHCMAFDPIGAIVVPKRCDNYRAEEWRAGEFSTAIYFMIHHTPVLVTTHYTNFAYLFINKPESGVMTILYDKQNDLHQNGPDNLVIKGKRYPEIKTLYYKKEGPAVFPCE